MRLYVIEEIPLLGLVLYKLLNNNRLPFIDPYAEQILYQPRPDAYRVFCLTV